jgi:hypothetical protein
MRQAFARCADILSIDFCERKRPMYLVRISALCYSRFLEVLPEEVENTELFVEELIGHIFLSMCGEVVLDEIGLAFSAPSAAERQYSCSIRIHAHYPIHTWCAYTLEEMGPALEAKLNLALTELFGAVDIEQIIIGPAPVPWPDHPAQKKALPGRAGRASASVCGRGLPDARAGPTGQRPPIAAEARPDLMGSLLSPYAARGIPAHSHTPHECVERGFSAGFP